MGQGLHTKIRQIAALEFGIDMTKDPIPVVPAAHYTCGGVVVDLLNQRKATHLILESTFTRLTDLAYDMFFIPSFLITSKYQSIDALERLDIPSLVVHGTKDTLIHVEHGKKLYAALKRKKDIFLMDTGHSDPPTEPDKYVGAISRLLEK